MNTIALRRLAAWLAALILVASLPGAAPDPAATARRDLLDLLERKGLITAEEAAGLATPAPSAVIGPGNKAITKLTLGGRIQAQFAALSGEDDSAADPSARNHFLLRRVYLSAKAELGPDWRLNLTYNFANSLFDVAAIQWARPDLTVDAGYRMVNFGREQRTSSGALKAIERSAVTRYFVESNNGTRLGAGSYRVGVFADGKTDHAFWGAAVTNPEQPVSSADAAGTGSGVTNQPALWLDGGLRLAPRGAALRVGAAAGWLPDQGGRTPGSGDDLLVGSAHAELVAGPLSVLAEVFVSHHPGGAADGSDTRALGAYLQPAWRFGPRLEGVARIGYLDTDGRGVRMADAIPGSPTLPATDRLWDAYLGGTWYLRGDDLKFQAGLVCARGEDTPAGTATTSGTFGVRSQVQMNF